MADKGRRPPEQRADRLGWEKPGAKGVFRMVNVEDLLIDPGCQRKEVGYSTILRIASEFNWEAFGSLTVAEREDGSLYVVDGQQRLVAAKKRGDIPCVPCTVFQSRGRDWEARAFKLVNQCRSPVSAFDKYAVAVTAKLEPERSIEAWLESYGMKVGRTGAAKTIDFPGLLTRLWVKDAHASQSALLLQVNILDGSPLFSDLHWGIWWLLRNGVSVWEYVDKIKLRGGGPGFKQAVRRMSLENSVGVTDRVCGYALLSMVNYGKRLKIRLQGEMKD